MKKLRRSRWLIAALVLLTVAAACGGDDDDDSDASSASDASTTVAESAPAGDAGLDELIAAAQDEGKVVFYGAANENALQAVADAFGEKYDIDAEFVRLSSGDMPARFLAEVESGDFVADVLLTTDSPDDSDSFLASMHADGYTVALSDAGLPGFPWDFPEKWLRESRAIVHIMPWLFGYNTDLISGDPPSTWADLLDPKYKGQILTGDLSSLASVQIYMAVLEEYGEEWFEEYRAQEFRTYASAAPAAEALAAGEGAIGVNLVGTLISGAKERGAPVEMVIPDVTIGVEMGVAVVDPTRSDHPNAAKLFVSYLMSEEGAGVLNGFEAVFSPYATDDFPEGYVPPPLNAEASRDKLAELLGVPAR